MDLYSNRSKQQATLEQAFQERQHTCNFKFLSPSKSLISEQVSGTWKPSQWYSCLLTLKFRPLLVLCLVWRKSHRKYNYPSWTEQQIFCDILKPIFNVAEAFIKQRLLCQMHDVLCSVCSSTHTGWQGKKEGGSKTSSPLPTLQSTMSTMIYLESDEVCSGSQSLKNVHASPFWL